MVDEAKLNQLVGKMLGDLGGAFSVPMVRMGDTARPLQGARRKRADDTEGIGEGDAA